jgi:hypothetical protein
MKDAMSVTLDERKKAQDIVNGVKRVLQELKEKSLHQVGSLELYSIF